MSIQDSFLFVHMSHACLMLWKQLLGVTPAAKSLFRERRRFRRNVTLVTVGPDLAPYHCLCTLKLEVTRKSWRNIKASALWRNLCGFSDCLRVLRDSSLWPDLHWCNYTDMSRSSQGRGAGGQAARLCSAFKAHVQNHLGPQTNKNHTQSNYLILFVCF